MGNYLLGDFPSILAISIFGYPHIYSIPLYYMYTNLITLITMKATMQLIKYHVCVYMILYFLRAAVTFLYNYAIIMHLPHTTMEWSGSKCIYHCNMFANQLKLVLPLFYDTT